MSARSERVVVCAVARTPFGRFGGRLAALSGPRLAALAIDEVIRRAGVEPSAIEMVFAGTGMVGGATLTAARQALLLSSLPETTPSTGVDRACCSGMTAIGLGWQTIRSGAASAVICGGFDSLSQTPMLWPRPHSARVGPIVVGDPLQMKGDVIDRPIAVYTGEEAQRHGIDRAMQDAWAVASHRRYFDAEARGYFDFERFAVSIESVKDGASQLTTDESPRADTSIEKIARLAPIYGGLTVTAGNAPGLNDGAAFLLLCDEAYARDHALPILAGVRGYAIVAGGPTSGSYTPAVAIKAVLDREGKSADTMQLLEINEAFAATPLVSTQRLAGDDPARSHALRERTNVHGGAVAIGHPLGASGARIAMTIINGLRQRGGGEGAAAICGGFGQGEALLIDVDGEA